MATNRTSRSTSSSKGPFGNLTVGGLIGIIVAALVLVLVIVFLRGRQRKYREDLWKPVEEQILAALPGEMEKLGIRALSEIERGPVN